MGDWPYSVLYNPLGHIHIHRHKNSHSALLLSAVFISELVKWLKTLNTGQCLHAQTHTHAYIYQYRCDILVAFAFGCCRGPFGWTENLDGPKHGGSRASFFNGWFTFLHNAATFLDAWSLILLLFKSDMSDYAVLALHNAAKIRHQISLSWQQTDWNKRISSK